MRGKPLRTDEECRRAPRRCLQQYGPNVLPRGKRDGPLILLWRQIHNPLIWVLIASGGVAMAVDWTAVALLMTVAAVGAFLWEYYTELGKGVPAELALAESQTIAVTTIIVFQCFYLANCRSLRHSFTAVGAFTNKIFYVGVALVLLLQAAFIYLPPAHVLFGSAPLNLEAWAKAAITGAVILPVMIFEKRVIRPLS